jgi:hypothetical protein
MSFSNPRARILIGEETLSADKRRPQIEEGAFTAFDSFTNKSFFAGLTVELTTGKASQAEFTVVDEDYSFIDAYTRSDGVMPCAAYVYLGYGEEFGEPVFEGLLAAVEHNDVLSTFCFYDRSLRMKLIEKSEYHKELDVDVMRKLVERNGLNFVLADKSIKGLPLKAKKQEEQTDRDLLMSLTQEAGLVVWVRGNTLYLARPARVGEPVLTLDRRDVLALKGESLRYEMPENVDGSPASIEVRVRGRGGRRQSGHSVKRARGRKIIAHHSLRSSAPASEAGRRAQAIQDIESEPSFSCKVKTLFHPATRLVGVRQTVWLENRGSLFSGLYLVDGVHLDFSPGSLTIDFDLVRDALSCKELLAIPNAENVYPYAYRRCQGAGKGRNG